MSEKNENAGGKTAENYRSTYLSRITTILQRNKTRRQINYISKIFLIVGIIIGVKYIILSLYGTSLIEGGGSTGAVQTGLFVLFASGVLAVGTCYISSRSAPDIQTAVAGSAVGAFFGAIGILLATVFSEQFVGSDFISSIAGSNIQGLLKYLVIYSGGIGVVGGITGYISFMYPLGTTKDSTKSQIDGDADDENTKQSAEHKTGLNRISQIIKNNFNTIKIIVYLYGAVGIGYSASAILLGIFFSGFKMYAIYVTLIASYGIVFSSPMLSAYLGHKIGRNHTGASGIITGGIGAGVGFIIMVLIMSVIGSLGISQNPITPLAGVIGSLSANPLEAAASASGQTPKIVSAILSAIPKGHEVSNIMLVGAFGNAVAGAVIAGLTGKRN